MISRARTLRGRELFQQKCLERVLLIEDERDRQRVGLSSELLDRVVPAHAHQILLGCYQNEPVVLGLLA